MPQHATYICLCAKMGKSKLIPQTGNDWLWDLLMVIAKAKRTGNCKRLESKGKSVRVSGIRGVKTSYPLYFLLMIVASMTLFISLVSLRIRGLFKYITKHDDNWSNFNGNYVIVVKAIPKNLKILDYVFLVCSCVNWFVSKQLSR